MYLFRGGGAVASEKPNSPANNPSMYGGVILHSGEFAVSEIDLQIPGRGFDFAFRRTYRSQVVYSGVLGWGWDHTYNRRILKMPGGDLLYYDGSGRRERFKAKKSGDTITGYEAPKGFFVKVKKYEDGTIKLLHSDRFLEVFDSSGRLIELEDRNENRMEFFYNINGQLSTIVDTMERKFRLEYFPFEDAEGERMVDYKSGRIKSISDFSGRKVTYTYKEGSGDLEKVDFAGRVKEYTYSTDAKDIKLAHNLLTYTDPEGQQVVSVSYDTEKQDKVISIDRGGSSTSFACGGSASVTDGSGNSKTFIHNDKGNPTSIGAGGYSTTFSTNDDGLITDVTYPEGNSVSYTYGGSDEDKRSKGNLISIQENPGWRGSSDPDEFTRTTTFSYENYFNQVTSVSTPGGLSISNSDQDEQGNFRQVSTNIPGISYNYSYTEHGRLQSETGPFGLTGNYSYGNNGKGYLEQISSSYENESLSSDEVGNLTGYSSSRGVSSSYSLNEHGEVTSESTTASGSISPLSYSGNYTYNKNGLVTAASTSYGTGAGIIQNSSSYTYDRRYNLLSESESSRGTTSYAYDNNDNVTSISGPLSTVSFNYNSRDLISSMTTGGGTGGRTYSFSYDGNANMVSATDPYGHYTAYEYDGFDRLRRTIDPLSNETVLARGNFGNLLTIKRMNSAGETLRETTRLNDPLGRMTQYVVKVPGAADEVYDYAYADSGKTVTVTDSLLRAWTVKKNENGQVYEESDPAGNKIEYFYLDGRGNMTKKIETVKGADATPQTITTLYRYNDFSKIEEITENAGTAAEAVTVFVYDARGNLSGSKDAEGNTISHGYDTLGRKLWTTRHFKDGTDIKTEFSYYANDLLKTVTDAHGNITSYEYDDQR